jgi:hypothetical protein
MNTHLLEDGVKDIQVTAKVDALRAGQSLLIVALMFLKQL